MNTGRTFTSSMAINALTFAPTLALILTLILIMGVASPSMAAVHSTVRLNRPVVTAEKAQTVYALVQFDVDEIVPEQRRPRAPLAISLVIDRSGSMQAKGKLVYAVAAAKQIVDRLSPADTLSIVEYDERVTVAWPQAPVTHPEAVKAVIDRLTPRGSTNLAGGMMEGVHQVARAERAGAVRRVILLSDGLANQGVTDPSSIAVLASRAAGRGVNVTTMGLGLDYDEDLMQAIAESGGGRYYYIESPTQVAGIFNQEMDVLFNLVTRDLTLEILPGAFVRNTTVYGYNTRVRKDGALIDMSDLAAGEQRSMLIRLDIAPLSAPSASLGRIRIHYQDLVTRGNRSFDLDIPVETSPDPSRVSDSENRDISVEAILITADQEHEESVRNYEKGQVAEAKQQMGSLARKLDQDLARYDDVKIRKKLEALTMESREIERSEQEPTYRQSYLKKSKQAFYQSKKGGRDKYLLMEGAKSPDVANLQKALRKKGFYSGPEDGRYNPMVSEAVRKYQRANNLEPDGVAGPMTLRSLGLY